MSIDPVRYFEIRGQVYPLLSVASSPGIASNNTIIGAVSGKIILVMGLIAQSASLVTQGTFNLKDGSGGTALTNAWAAPLQTDLPWVLPIIPEGYPWRTTVSVGLFSDVVAQAVNLNIFYIAYTP